jgi:formate hydrogenlyase subunit 3/multisubunit Na+/H+ antiporter MnhD subunit
LLGAFLTSRWYAVAATTGVILAAVYLLWAVQRAFTGEPDEKNAATRDIGFREICTVAPLLGLSLFLGFYPKPVLDRLEPSVDALVSQIDTHSNLKSPIVNFADGKCVVDATGRYTISIDEFVANQHSKSVLLGSAELGPCEATQESGK